jgi:hypothetical protein
MALRVLASGLLLAMSGAAAWAQSRPAPMIADEGTLGRAWALAGDAPLATATYPPAQAGRGDDACIALGYAIAPDGRTSGFRVLRQWSSAGSAADRVPDYWRAFAEAAAAAVVQWRFVPRPDVPAPAETTTVATIAFLGGGDADPARVRGECAIADLAARLQELDDSGRQAFARQEALRRLQADGAWHRREQQMLPESSVDIGSNRPVHRW